MSAYNINLNIKAANQTGAAFKGARSNMQSLQQQQFAAVKSSKMFQRSIQQAGMQVSDFAVQVGGGQSAILAFTQNAPQFVQSFGAIGGVIAAVISIGGVLALMWSRSRQSSKKTEKAVDDLSRSLSTYSEVSENSRMTQIKLTEEFGAFGVKLKELDVLLKSVSLDNVLADLEKETGLFSAQVKNAVSLTEELRDTIIAAGESWSLMDTAVIRDLTGRVMEASEKLNLLPQEIRDVQSSLDAVQGAKSIQEIRDTAFAALDLLKGIEVRSGGLNAELRATVLSLNKVLRTTGRIAETDMNKGIQKAASSAAVLAKELGVSLRLASKIIALGTKTDPSIDPRDSSYNAIFAEMQRIKNEYSKVLRNALGIAKVDINKGIQKAASSAAVLAKELGVSLVLASKILALGTKTDPSLDPRDSSYNAIFAEMQRIKNEYSKVLRNALGIAKVDINKGMREAASSAGRLAEELGVSLGLASKIMALGTKTDPSLDPRDPTYNATFAEMQRIKNEYGKSSPFEPDKNTKTAALDAGGVEALKEAYDSLLGSLSPAIQASQDFARAQNTINSAMRAGVITADEASTAMEMLKYSTSELKDVMGTVESSMSSAFMSMVDGTKTAADAFRDMARDIIKKLYDILVVQRLVGSFDGKTGTGLAGIIGGWMSGGGMFGNFTNVSGVRANGGGISAGSPYIVGERGPELIIPGRSGTVIPNSNLGGGGGNVTINNTFTGGVTRADLGEMIPKIVEASKRAVLDARKRGGSYAAGFGG